MSPFTKTWTYVPLETYTQMEIKQLNGKKNQLKEIFEKLQILLNCLGKVQCPSLKGVRGSPP